MTTSEFANILRKAGIQNSARLFKDSHGDYRLIIDTQYPQDRQLVIDKAEEAGLRADPISMAMGAHKPGVRVVVFGLTPFAVTPTPDQLEEAATRVLNRMDEKGETVDQAVEAVYPDYPGLTAAALRALYLRETAVCGVCQSEPGTPCSHTKGGR
jgi:hypothetical protein